MKPGFQKFVSRIHVGVDRRGAIGIASRVRRSETMDRSRPTSQLTHPFEIRKRRQVPLVCFKFFDVSVDEGLN